MDLGLLNEKIWNPTTVLGKVLLDVVGLLFIECTCAMIKVADQWSWVMVCYLVDHIQQQVDDLHLTSHW